MKTTKIIYWTATIIIFLLDGLMPALTSNTDLAKEGIRHLGYPDYFRVMLTFFKIIGAILLIVPAVKGRVKEWAYAGFAFNFLSAAASHWIVDGFNGQTIFPLVAFGILAVSYIYYHKLVNGKESQAYSNKLASQFLDCWNCFSGHNFIKMLCWMINRSVMVLLLLVIHSLAFSQEAYPVRLSASLWHNEKRELRYRPEGEDFVITNGDRLFTRALYGTHSAFRIETGDRPEFALYMPGMGGNFKFGIESADSSKWLTEAKTITARYRAGSMRYTIRDPMLEAGQLELTVLALADAEGFIVRARFINIKNPLKLIWAFGGATGKKFSRDGDMGPDPPANFYLKPENCKDNSYIINKTGFSLKYGAGLQVGKDGRYFAEDTTQVSQTLKEQFLAGIFPPDAMVKIADASELKTPANYFSSSVNNSPAFAGRLKPLNGKDYYFAILNPATKPAFDYSLAGNIFLQAEEARKLIAGRIKIKTPDPYINTIGGALAIASDALWEAPSYLHGSIGWRMRLDGWRGAYTADALGWHDRAETHLESYLQSQVMTPESGPIIADTATHLARSLEKLGTGIFTAGFISRDPLGKNLRAHHYDMNLVFFDILLRHYAWTGDMEFLKKTWPNLKLHLQWEKRNFDADGDGLYDAYAAIWASDALQYSGGGVAHTSAYNYYANKKAAEIARLIGEDPTLYRNESLKILHAMNNNLWMNDKGSYAEYKDLLGNQLLHISPALWTIYHSMDSETLDPFQAYLSMRYIDNEIPKIPVRAKGLEDKGYYNLSTTSWMPYTWSLNNAALAESMHTVLANWQSGRVDEAFKLFKSEILSSMYLGGSPGNIVQISHYDAMRGEAYRDFGDPVGIFSRALVEGLFGIVPDALNKQVLIRPGLPSGWHYASFSTPDISFDFKRSGRTDTYKLIPRFPTKPDLKFQVIAQGQVDFITINGKPVIWKNIESSVGKPVIEIDLPYSKQFIVRISWKGEKPFMLSGEKSYTQGSVFSLNLPITKIKDPQSSLSEIEINSTGLEARVQKTPGKYTFFLQVRQGSLLWWLPVCFEVAEPVDLVLAKGNSFQLKNNAQQDIRLQVNVNNFQTSLFIPSGKMSDQIVIPREELIAGTNTININLPNEKIVKQLIDWSAPSGKTLETADLSGVFNDKVTQIFKNKYLSPRPTVSTLQLPWQGTGDWPHPLETHDINDSGLRRLAGAKNIITLPQGLVFSTPGDDQKNNIAYTSQWDNYPKEIHVPLSGKASHAWLLMAGSTNPMQSQMTNGRVIFEYSDSTDDTLELRNPETWWPIEKDYYTDGFAFNLKQPRPLRLHLKTGRIVSGEESEARYNGKEIDGGAATVLDLPLNHTKTLRQAVLKTVANDVVIGLMAITLSRVN